MKIGSQTIAVVTGAASGIGRALAAELARRGATLALIDIDRAGLNWVANLPTLCSTYVCDVADADAVSAVASAVVKAHGAVHLLVNNAGVSVAGSIEGFGARRLPAGDGREFLGQRPRLQGIPATPSRRRGPEGRGGRLQRAQ